MDGLGFLHFYYIQGAGRVWMVDENPHSVGTIVLSVRGL
jgi:hypothetical protein